MSKFLNQGSYGCIFKPGVKCDGTPSNSKYLSKIQKKKPRTENEPIIGRRIRETVENHERYYAPALEVCKANISMINPSEVKKCKVMENETSNVAEEFVSIKMRYIGNETLGDNLDKHYQKSPETFLAHLKDIERYLGAAVKELVRIEVVHNDLKLNNVMYSKEWKVPIIIDFGMAYEMKTLYSGNQMNTVFFTHYEKYPPWCLEKLYIGVVVKTANWENKNVEVDSLKKITNTFFKENQYDVIQGTLTRIGSDALAPIPAEGKGYRFPAQITLKNQYLEVKSGKKLPLQNGMSLSANIKLRKVTYLQLLFTKFSKKADSLKSI